MFAIITSFPRAVLEGEGTVWETVQNRGNWTGVCFALFLLTVTLGKLSQHSPFSIFLDHLLNDNMYSHGTEACYALYI